MGTYWRNDELSDDMADMSDVEMDMMSLRDVFECLGPNRLDKVEDKHLDRNDIPFETMERVQDAIDTYESEISSHTNHEECNFTLLTAIGELDEISFAETYGNLLFIIAESLYDSGDYALSYLFSHSTVRNMSMFEDDCGEKQKEKGGLLITTVCEIGCKALFWMVCKQPHQEGKRFLLETMDLYTESIMDMDPEKGYIDLSAVRFHIAGNYAFFDELDSAEREYLYARDFVKDKQNNVRMHRFSIICKTLIKLSQLHFKRGVYDKAFRFSTNALISVDTAQDFDDDDRAGWKEHMQQVHHKNVVKLQEILGVDKMREIMNPCEVANQEVSAEASAEACQEENGESCEGENGESCEGANGKSCEEEHGESCEEEGESCEEENGESCEEEGESCEEENGESCEEENGDSCEEEGESCEEESGESGREEGESCEEENGESCEEESGESGRERSEDRDSE